MQQDLEILWHWWSLIGPWIGYIHGGNTGLFYYETKSGIISQAARQQGTQIRIPSLLFVHCNRHLFVLLRNTCILSCQELFNVGHVQQDNQMMPVSPVWRKWGPKPLLAQGATIPVTLWSSGQSMTVTQQNYQLSLWWNNHQLFHDTNTYIHQVTHSQDFWRHQGILKSSLRWSACLRAT